MTSPPGPLSHRPHAQPGEGESLLRAIWIKRAKRGPMDERGAAMLVAGKGLAGNANQKGRRQVTLIEEERWADAMDDLAAALDPSTRRANLMISGLRLVNRRGQILRIGSCRLRIWSECPPCYQMDEAYPGLRSALRPDWRGGACAEVLDDGEIRVGETVEWEPEMELRT